ncbi:MAG: hypothetical protein JWO02_4479 [Solirubrobacterales bacterium]|nr:hypothetical protein [Solirubrobacterales bacterium]
MSPSPPQPPLRAGDADREATLVLLREATVDGRLTVDELAERAALTHAARTHAELDAVTADLHAPPTVVQLAGSPPAAAPVGVTESHRTVLSFARHTGRRAMAARSRFSCTLGNIHLDLRDVVLPGPQVDIEIRAVLGWVQVVVPEGIEVRMVGDGLLTNREVHLRAVPVPPGAPVVCVHVSGVLGSVSVRSRPRGAARKRGRPAGA